MPPAPIWIVSAVTTVPSVSPLALMLSPTAMSARVRSALTVTVVLDDTATCTCSPSSVSTVRPVSSIETISPAVNPPGGPPSGRSPGSAPSGTSPSAGGWASAGGSNPSGTLTFGWGATGSWRPAPEPDT